MGYSSWSGDAYKNISAPRKDMDYARVKDKVFSKGLKSSLDPKGVKMRESRDSDDHPESNAIGVVFDVTGSMGGIPADFAQHKLGGLMKMLVDKGVIAHPQVLFGAVGDSHIEYGRMTDTTPLQVGQFESGLEIDQCLTDIFIESGGGGQIKESYGLAHYFFARHTSIDCWDKRGKKGYLFTIGDEQTWPTIAPGEVSNIFGDTIQAEESVADLIRECERRYNVFHIVVATHTSESHPEVLKSWLDLLGERALRLDSPNDVCELIAATIGLCEGHTVDAMSAVLRDVGASAGTVKSVGAAIVPLRDALARGGAGSIVGTLPAGGKSGAARI